MYASAPQYFIFPESTTTSILEASVARSQRRGDLRPPTLQPPMLRPPMLQPPMLQPPIGCSEASD